MTYQQLILEIEKEFDEFDRIEAAQLEEILEKHKHVKEEFLDSTEKEEISHFLQETREKFNELIIVISPEGTITPSNRVKAVGLSKDIYIDAMLSLHLTRDLDLRNPVVKRKFLGGSPLEKATPPDSLYKKIKTHLIVGELCFVLGIRTSTELEDRGAFAEFSKVTGEGIILYDHFVDCPEKNPKKALATLKLIRDMAIAYTRLAALYAQEAKEEKSKTYAAQANGWFNEMFNLNNSMESPFDVNSIFPSKEAFKRYLADIQNTKAPCVFQYEKDRRITCVKQNDSPERLCQHKKEGLCSYILDGDIVQKALAARKDDRYI